MLGFLRAMAIALRHDLGWYPFRRHFCINLVMCFCPVSFAHTHLRTWYVIWEWPGAEFEVLLKIASRTSSGVISVKGRSVSRREVVLGRNSWSRIGGGWYSSLRRASHLSSWVIARGWSGPREMGGVG